MPSQRIFAEFRQSLNAETPSFSICVQFPSAISTCQFARYRVNWNWRLGLGESFGWPRKRCLFFHFSTNSSRPGAQGFGTKQIPQSS